MGIVKCAMKLVETKVNGNTKVKRRNKFCRVTKVKHLNALLSYFSEIQRIFVCLDVGVSMMYLCIYFHFTLNNSGSREESYVCALFKI